ncbi:hypothetical protein NQB57_004288 [Escherichia coli]|nr:hypothetical protein [Escherichia coli]
MSAFSFNTTYQPTGDQQKDAVAQIDIMQSRAVQANLAYQSSLDAETLMVTGSFKPSGLFPPALQK